jgi:hypothetical protein
MKRPPRITALLFVIAVFLTNVILPTSDWSFAQRVLWLLLVITVVFGLAYVIDWVLTRWRTRHVA